MLAGFVLLSAVFGSQQAHAQKPVITEVFVDFGTNTIIITGINFDSPWHVTLGIPGAPGNISDQCVPDFSDPLAQTFTCDFSTSGLPDDGDYLITVFVA